MAPRPVPSRQPASCTPTTGVLDVRVGTSGWMYDSWRGTFYPAGVPVSRWLSTYAETFDVVEVNGTFYRLARRDAVERWAAAVPDGFRFVIKGSRYLTHSRKLGELAVGIRRFFAPLEPLGPALTAVLWQLPPWMSVDVALLERFLAAVAEDPLGRVVQQAVEVRNRSWQVDETYRMLERWGAMSVNVSGPQLPADLVVTGGRAYVRFHGLEAGAAYDYSDADLRPWALHLRRHRRGLAFFNNDAGARAVDDARQLLRLLGEPAQRGAVHAGQLV